MRVGPKRKFQVIAGFWHQIYVLWAVVCIFQALGISVGISVHHSDDTYSPTVWWGDCRARVTLASTPRGTDHTLGDDRHPLSSRNTNHLTQLTQLPIRAHSIFCNTCSPGLLVVGIEVHEASARIPESRMKYKGRASARCRERECWETAMAKTTSEKDDSPAHRWNTRAPQHSPPTDLMLRPCPYIWIGTLNISTGADNSLNIREWQIARRSSNSLVSHRLPRRQSHQCRLANGDGRECPLIFLSSRWAIVGP